MDIDETTDIATHYYRLTQTQQLDGHTVRVRVHRDFYQDQSWAVADVLTPALTWTEIATAPANDWHPSTPPVRTAATDGLACLRPVADHLTERAHRLLHNNTRPTGPAAEFHPAAGPTSPPGPHPSPSPWHAPT